METAKLEKAKETQPVVKEEVAIATVQSAPHRPQSRNFKAEREARAKEQALSELRVKEKVVKLNLVRTVVITVNKVRDVQTMSEMIDATIVVTSVQKSGKTTDLVIVAIIVTIVVRTTVQVSQLALNKERLQNQQDLKLTSKRVLL